MKILESDDSKADDEQREGQEGHNRERSFEVKDDHQTRLKEQFTNHSNPGNPLVTFIHIIHRLNSEKYQNFDFQDFNCHF